MLNVRIRIRIRIRIPIRIVNASVVVITNFEGLRTAVIFGVKRGGPSDDD